jgi:HAD superfamily hydrolase (TIGR01456 family)
MSYWPGCVLDIDGLLLRGGHPIEGASASLQRLQALSLPMVFCTNACGRSEAALAHHLTEALSLATPVLPAQIVMSHTPALSLLPALSMKKVLVTGTRAMFRVVRETYGFGGAVWATEVIDRWPTINPVRARGEGMDKEVAPPHDAHGHDELEKVPFEAVFVFQEPSDYHDDLQLIIDVVRFDGVLPRTREEWEARRKAEAEGPPREQKVKVYFANPDLEYQALHPVPRFTMGAFVLCLKTLYREIVGRDLELHAFGKPELLTYAYAAERLASQSPARAITHFFCVGDNPKSDIRGANNMAKLTAAATSQGPVPVWSGILVRTGVWHGEINDPTDPATHVVPSIIEAAHIITKDISF